MPVEKQKEVFEEHLTDDVEVKLKGRHSKQFLMCFFNLRRFAIFFHQIFTKSKNPIFGPFAQNWLSESFPEYQALSLLSP